jgi:hypothetical protein
MLDPSSIDLMPLALVGYLVGSLFACIYTLGMHEGKRESHHDR